MLTWVFIFGARGADRPRLAPHTQISLDGGGQGGAGGVEAGAVAGDDLAHIVYKRSSRHLLVTRSHIQEIVCTQNWNLKIFQNSKISSPTSPPPDDLLSELLQLAVEGLDQLALVHLGLACHVVRLGRHSLLQFHTITPLNTEDIISKLVFCVAFNEIL